MGVNHLHKKIIQRQDFDQDNGKNKQPFADVIPPGKESARIGVDVSQFLHQAVSRKLAAQSHHTVPLVRNGQTMVLYPLRIIGDAIEPRATTRSAMSPQQE
jgi:hypothetical protein